MAKEKDSAPVHINPSNSDRSNHLALPSVEVNLLSCLGIVNHMSYKSLTVTTSTQEMYMYYLD